MDRTREEIATRALRMIGVVAADEAPTADQSQTALGVLDGIWGELLAEAQPTWDITTGTPPAGFIPMASWLAAELAPEYAMQPPMSRGRAKLRVLAVVRPDDRTEDPCDYDPASDYGMGARTIYVAGGSGANTNYAAIYEAAKNA